MIREGCSIVLTTHYLEEAEALADRVAVLAGGRLIACGTVEEFRTSSDPRVSDFIEGRAPVKESVETLLST